MDAFPGQDKYLRAVPIALTVIATVLVAARMFTVWRHRGFLGLEEAMVICSNAVMIGFCIILNLAAQYGFGHHTKDIPKMGGNVHTALKYYFLSQLFYKVNITFNKLAFLLLYLRVFSTPLFRKICRATLAVIVLGSFAFVIATIFQCTPIRKSWNKANVPGHCINNSWFRWTWAAFNLLSDIFVFTLPLPVIGRLQMTLAKKLGLMILFTLGLFVCITTAIRMKALVQSTHAVDQPWDSCTTNLWSFIEAAMGLICACLISLRKAASACFPGLLSSVGKSKSSQYAYGYGSNARRAPGVGSQRLSEYGLENMESTRNHDGKMLGQSFTTVGHHHELRKTESQDHILRGITVQRDVSVRSEQVSEEMPYPPPPRQSHEKDEVVVQARQVS
ncbi:hypothetical protein BU16DRAFT_105746 [Lophium mytilinum]|uniref:Rhodopsin domain-containing protein n=1 Tax=Lophium mytilinum TaxID=390894 RepID=A0A6A6QMN3_9PEZI|nr:hypothetical protein BU16DRAFT_105746 [Lophium mytilinum]